MFFTSNCNVCYDFAILSRKESQFQKVGFFPSNHDVCFVFANMYPKCLKITREMNFVLHFLGDDECNLMNFSSGIAIRK